MKQSIKTIIGGLVLISTLTLSACGENPTPSVNPSTEQPPVTSEVEEEKFEIKWMVEGQVVETDQAVKGSMPKYDGAVPTKQGTAKYSYTFDKWEPTPVEVVADATYTATFKETINKYTVTFNTDGGSEVASITKDYGSTIEKPTDPIKDGFKFIGWTYDEAHTKEVTFPFTLEKDVTLYASFNEKVHIKDYLNTLANGYKLNPLQYVPEKLMPSNIDTLMPNKGAEQYDFNTPVAVSKLKKYGYGEQWAMVLDNLHQTETFFNALEAVNGVITGAVSLFDNYLDNNPSDTAHHQAKYAEWNVTIDFDGVDMNYVIEGVLFGKTAQVALSLHVEDGSKACRIQISDANALKYIVKDNYYSFGLRLAGVRRSYFEIKKDPKTNNVEGAIFEHTGVDGKLDVKSAAQFASTGDYTYVVGNKASGILGAKNTIVEMYDNKNGNLVGYEVEEHVTKPADVTFNTLWFNLGDTSGINQVQVLEQPGEYGPNGEVIKEPVYETRINNSTHQFNTKKVGGFSAKAFSRRFDIELRKRYFTYLEADAENKGTYVTEAYETPMLFVQEEMLDTLKADIEKANVGLSFSLNVNTQTIKLLTEMYKQFLPIFKQNKDTITQEVILSYIGEKVVF